MRFCDSWGDTLPTGHLCLLLSSSVPTSLASHSSKLRPDGQCAGWVLTRSVHNTKPFHTGAVNQITLARNLQMCLDKRMRVSASPIAIYCGGWGCRIRHFLLIPVVFAVTSGPSFIEAERGHASVALGWFSSCQRQIEGTDSHVWEEIGFFSPFGVSEETRQLTLVWMFHQVSSLSSFLQCVLGLSEGCGASYDSIEHLGAAGLAWKSTVESRIFHF